MASIIALIPARSGSKRVPNKNIKELGGHPLMAWSIVTALEAGIFEGVYVSTDSDEYAEIASEYGAVPIRRPGTFAVDNSPDIEWVRHAFTVVRADAFAILRPTSPFRTARTIQRAWRLLQAYPAHSVRAVEPTRAHPGKLWTQQADGRIESIWPRFYDDATLRVPYHSMPTQFLPEVLQQNASLEMAWAEHTVRASPPSIAGSRVWPFRTEGYEGFDINVPEDWIVAEHLVATEKVAVPEGLHAHRSVGLQAEEAADAGGLGDRSGVQGESLPEGAVDSGVVRRRGRPRKSVS